MWTQFDIPYQVGIFAISILLFIYSFLLLHTKVIELQSENKKLLVGMEKILSRIDELKPPTKP